MSEVIRVNPGPIADFTHGLTTYAAELENIAQTAANLVHQHLGNSWNTSSGSVAFGEVQQMINDGIQDGKDVILRHGNAVDTSVNEFVSYDIGAGNSFHGV